MKRNWFTTRFTKNFLRLYLPQHIVVATGLFYYSSSLTHFWPWILLGWVVLGPIGIGIGYHRLLSHQSFQCSRPTKAFLWSLGALAGQGPPIEFLAVHLHHHSHSDQNTDIHSPHNGFWNSFLLWRVFKKAPITLPYSQIKKVCSSNYLKWLDRNYYSFYWLSLLVCFLLAPQWTFFLLVIPSLVTFYEINAVDYFCHKDWFGYRNFDAKDSSVNNLILGWITLGVGFHNNHHRFPNRSQFSSRWYEFDLGGLLVKVLERL